MSVVVFALGILLAVAGVALIGFGIPINGLPAGSTLILAGTGTLVGGILMVGLAAVVAELARVATLLRTRPAATRPARTAEQALPSAETVAREQPVEPMSVAAPAPAMAVSASAIERMRTSIPRTEKTVPEAEEVPLSPNGGQANPVETRLESAPRMDPVARPAAATATVEAREPRLDFLFRPRQARPATQQQEAFDELWPKRPGRDEQPDLRVEVARAPAPAPVAAPIPAPESDAVDDQPAPQPPVPSAQEQRQVAILKSGVVDGMAYTLYADGSIEAQLPQGTVRFGSIAELRAHIENQS